MARIRSLLPGQWTDEDFVVCSIPARYLCLGLRNEADDHGVFEWKPITIKMRLMPADNVDIAALLAELEVNKQVRSFEFDGRKYGVIRNFCKYQRPKKPNYAFPFPPEFGTYVGLATPSSELMEDEGTPVPPKEELADQRLSRGNGRSKGSSEPNGSAAAAADDASLSLEARVYRDGKAILRSGGQVRKLIDAAGGLEEALLAIQQARTKGDPKEYLNGIIRNAKTGGVRRDEAIPDDVYERPYL